MDIRKKNLDILGFKPNTKVDIRDLDSSTPIGGYLIYLGSRWA